MSKETFDFSEALRRMRQGKWVKRKSAPFHYTLRRKDEQKFYCHDRIVYNRFCSRREALCLNNMNYSDILATDWEEVEE